MTSAEILLKHNIRPSLTRVMIFDYLRAHRTLSKTTVYNTMKLLSNEGIIKMITIEEQQARFDACADNHGHFLCNGCGKVFDFDINFPPAMLPDGFEISTRDIYFTGKCSKCE